MALAVILTTINYQIAATNRVSYNILAADHLLLIVHAGKVDEIPRDAHGGVAAPAAAAEAEHQVQRGLLLDVVVSQGAAVIQLLPGENEPLLIRRDACKFPWPISLPQLQQQDNHAEFFQLLHRVACKNDGLIIPTRSKVK